jgi:oligopeptide/dipeptide ABC transporter ATP-binding protein
MEPAPVLSVRGLTVDLPTDGGVVRAVNDVSFDVRRGETLGVVGESGAGKTVTMLALLGLLPSHAHVTGSVRLGGEELLGRSERDLQPVRGARLAMVFQDASSALNPVMRVGAQIEEAIRVHDRTLGGAELRERAIDLLDVVGVANPAQRHGQYPHEYSGGMRQRALLAMAVANEPEVLIADEPTTALDVTLQAQVLDVLERVQRRTGTAIVLVTHDLAVVAGIAAQVMVMYAGRVVESAEVDALFADPRHPYTRGLLATRARLDAQPGARLTPIPGSPPSLLRLPAGCAFHPRCAWADGAECATSLPALRTVGDGHLARCHFAAELDDRAVVVR